MASTTDAATNGPSEKPEAEASLEATAAATTTEGTDGVPPVESEQSDLPQEGSAPESVEEQEGAALAEPEAGAAADEIQKWPGWPGHIVFRMIVPVLKVGSIIGRKGELIKKMCEETRARIRILEGALGTNERIVLVSGKEEPDEEISPAMHAVIRVFKRIVGISDGEGDSAAPTGQPICSVRLLVASSQAITLIGKGGNLIKSIQEGSGASVRVLPGDELPLYAAPDERIVEIQGEPLKVLKGLELVVGQLRKFLVDQSVIPLFEKNYGSSGASVVQDRVLDSWADKAPPSIHATSHSGISSDYPPPLKRDPLYFDRDSHLDSHIQRSGLSLYGQDPAVAGHRSSGLGRSAGALVTQITQTMQIPLSYAEDIIGIGGANIAYIRRTSGAILTVQESRGLPDEITVEIKGTSTQVQTAQQLIQEFIAGHKEPVSSVYGSLDSGYLSSYSQLGSAVSSSLSQFLSHDLGFLFAAATVSPCCGSGCSSL